MKYTIKIKTHKPIDEVVELFDNQKNLKKWMSGLQSFKNINDTPSQEDAKSKLEFKSGKSLI